MSDRPREGTPSTASEALFRRDEVLQMMYWMRGEGLLDDVSAEDLLRFLRPTGETLPVEVVQGDLVALAEADLVEVSEPGRYRLTESGAAEGGRRFADEFDDMRGGGHGACSDPNCDCQELGAEACVHGAHAP